jgi:hypothetical protein
MPELVDVVADLVEVWQQPLVGALHVLGVAGFGAMVWTGRYRRWMWIWMLLTGVTLTLFNLERLLDNRALQAKLLLLGVLLFLRKPLWLVVVLWIAVIFASRAIAYF